MKKPLLLSVLALPLVAFVAPSRNDEDRAAVERAVLDYVEGVYEVKPELIERSVHPDLKKYGFWRESADQPYEGMAMTHAQLVELAANYNKDGKRCPPGSPKVIELLDVMDQTAAIKLTAAWGVDYMQLAKYEGKWKILHVLWQSHPGEVPSSDG
jgi:hypothetical protein